MNDVVLAADLGGTNLRMAAVTQDGAVEQLVKRPVPTGVTPAGLMVLIREMSQHVLASLENKCHIAAVAFTAPSPIPAKFDGVLTKLPNLDSITGMNLKTELEDEFAVPVTLENDATAAAIGENWIGASRSVANSIVVTLGTGIGGGIILDGRPIRGLDGIGGEIGHITVEPEGRRCKCGNVGCVEEYASATAILRMAQEAGLETSDAAEVYTAWKGGDRIAKEVFSKMGSYLGQMLAGLANTLNPEMLVVCGGVAQGFDAFCDQAQAEINKRAYPAAARRAPLVSGKLGDHAGMIGVARSAFLNKIGSGN